MIRALLYKECIKLRWFLLGLAVLSLLSCGNLFLMIRRMFESAPAIMWWTRLIQDGRLPYTSIRYNLILAGIVIAAAQYVPEVTKRRLRLLFHLPVTQTMAVYMMVATGLACVLVLGAIHLACLTAIVRTYFPPEAARSAVVTSIPWWMAGWIAYLGTALVLLEPAWWRRVAYTAASVFLTSLLMQGGRYDLYARVLWMYVGLAALFAVALQLPAYRVKRGIQ